MTGASICILITIILYLAGMLVIGIRCAKSTSSSSEFYLGGRTLGPFVTAMSAEASDMSSYLLMGLPGLAYLSGLADVGWTIIGLGLGTYLNWLLTAHRLRRYTEVTESYTLPQFFSRRFHDDKNLISALSALIIILFFIPYTASGFAACGKLFSSLFGWNYMASMLISAVIIVGYTAAGGFLAASFTDFIQSIIMTIAIFIVLVFASASAGGVGAVIENAKSLLGFLSLTSSYAESASTSVPYSLLKIISTAAWGLGYFGMPHILLRFMAIEDEKKLALSRRVASVWVVIAMAIAVFIGLAGRALSSESILPVLHGSVSETIIIRIADLLSRHGIIAAILAGLTLAGILASTMSTADSQLLAASSSVSENILQEAMKLKLGSRTSMLAARITVIIIAILGIIIARDPSSSIFSIVSFAWAGFGASFGPVVILALYWKRATLSGALLGMATGGISVLVWKFLISPLGGAFAIYELLPAFIIGLAVNIAVSLMSKAPDASVISEFEKARRG